MIRPRDSIRPALTCEATLGTDGTDFLGVALTDAGTISLPAGTLSVDGDFRPAATATTGVTVNSLGSIAAAGQLSVGGAASLAGTLTVSEAAGYLPPIGTKVVMMTATSLTVSVTESGP